MSSRAGEHSGPPTGTSKPPSVTAIVATLAEPARHASLLRAIDSLRAATRRTALTITAVVNGDRYSSAVLTDIATRGARVVQIAEGSLPAALLAGRRSVESDYYCFLDDDDEYLSDAIDRRLAALEGDPAAALVVSNGYRRDGDTDATALPRLSHAAQAPLAELFQANWLASCGALFRTSAVGVEFFEDPQPYLEWTWLAFKIAVSGKRIAVLDEPTFRIFDTPSSLSKSPAYLACNTALYRRMLRERLPHEIRRVVRRRLTVALSMESVALLSQQQLSASWRRHLEALGSPGGWRYAPHTLRLMTGTLQRVIAPRKAL